MTTIGIVARLRRRGRRKRTNGRVGAVHIIIDIDDRLVEVQIRTELQHLWAVLSETWADALDQSIKYGGGPPEIQENLRLKSEIVALMEIDQRRLLAEIDKWPHQRIAIGELHKIAGKLPPGAFERAGLARDFENLLRRERKMKERFMHDRYFEHLPESVSHY